MKNQIASYRGFITRKCVPYHIKFLVTTQMISLALKMDNDRLVNPIDILEARTVNRLENDKCPAGGHFKSFSTRECDEPKQK